MTTIDRRERRTVFQCRCHGTAIQGMTRPGQPETVQGVTGKTVQAVLLIRHSMNPRRSPFPGGHVANKVTSGKCLYSRCQKAFPCAAKYTGRQRFQERLPIITTARPQAEGQLLHGDPVSYSTHTFRCTKRRSLSSGLHECLFPNPITVIPIACT